MNQVTIDIKKLSAKLCILIRGVRATMKAATNVNPATPDQQALPKAYVGAAAGATIFSLIAAFSFLAFSLIKEW